MTEIRNLSVSCHMTNMAAMPIYGKKNLSVNCHVIRNLSVSCHICVSNPELLTLFWVGVGVDLLMHEVE